MAIMDYDSCINAAEERGEKRGEENGEQRMSALMQQLLSKGRMDDALKATSDKEYRQKLYKEFNL